jgi:hypothetical protein
MIPQTLVSLVLFLGLVAPGLFYQLLWERRHPTLEQTAFREASRTALTSLLFSGLACTVIILIRLVEPTWIFDLGQYLRDSKGYVSKSYGVIIRTVALEVVLALVIVGFVYSVPVFVGRLARLLPPKLTGWIPESLRAVTSFGEMSSGGIWFDVLRRRVKQGKKTWVCLRLTDGSRICGYVSHYTSAIKYEEREIALVKPTGEGAFISVSDTKLDPPQQNLGQEWEFVVVRGNEISFMQVTYLDTNLFAA